MIQWVISNEEQWTISDDPQWIYTDEIIGIYIMTTALSLITDAFITANLLDPGESIDSNDSAYGLRRLNRMIGLWSKEKMLVPFNTSENFSLSAGTSQYSMGSGGTASSVRAIRIVCCYILDPSNIGWPVEIISEKDWSKIRNRDYSTPIPKKLFYDATYAIGYINFWPTPSASGYTVYIESEKYMHDTLSLGTTVSLPLEFEQFIVSNLAMMLSSDYGRDPSQLLVAEAEKSRKIIIADNFTYSIPRIDFKGLFGSNVDFDINSGSTY